LLDDFCYNAWHRHVLLDKGIRVTAIRVTVIRVTAIRVTTIRVTIIRVTTIGVIAIGVKLKDFEDILCAC
jgi:hypothetical protein